MSRRSSTDSDPLLGRVLEGKYTLLSVLGRGGMGVVYKAHQMSLERSVALKLMMGVEPEREVEFQRRFFLEAATAAKLKHPNTITVFDYGSTEIDGERVFYITMELLDGQTLSRLLARHAPLDPLRAVNIALQMCRSLREAHAAGVVHRDLKPGNIMLVRQDSDDGDGDGDFVKVLDFGLAKTKAGGTSATGGQLTKAGTFLGSPRYVAPEQIEGRPVDGRADIYAFGCVFYRMLTGRVPFDGTQAVEVMLKHLHDPVPPLEGGAHQAAPSLEALTLACLEKKHGDRPKNMDEVITRLKRARQELGGGGAPSGLHALGSLSDDVQAHLAEGLLTSGPVPVAPEQTSPSQAAPPPMPPVPPVPPELSQSQSSVGPSPLQILSSHTPASLPSLGHSAEWQLGLTPAEESTRPTHAPGRLTVEPRRGPTAPLLFGLTLGLMIAGLGIAFRLGALDPLITAMGGGVPLPSTTTAHVGMTASEAASARLRIKTTPSGADVFEVTGGVTRLLGITPLVVPWEIAVGDPAKELLLKLPGHVPARARVEPPRPQGNGPVTLEVEAVLRAQK